MSQSSTQNHTASTKLQAISKEVFQIWITERPAHFAAALAYYAIFSIVPLIYIIFMVADLIYSQLSIANWFYTEVTYLLGEQVALYLQEGVADLAQTATGGTTLISTISLIAILLSTSIIFLQMRHTLNTIWLVPPRPQDSTIALVRNRLLAFVMLFGIFLFFILGAITNLVVSFIASLIQLNFIISILSFTLLVGLGMLTFALFYKLLPRAHVAWKFIWPAAGVAALFFALVVHVIGAYVSSREFGSAIEASGTMAVILIAFYILGQIFVLGAVLIRVLAAQAGEGITPWRV